MAADYSIVPFLSLQWQEVRSRKKKQKQFKDIELCTVTPFTHSPQLHTLYNRETNAIFKKCGEQMEHVLNPQHATNVTRRSSSLRALAQTIESISFSDGLLWEFTLCILRCVELSKILCGIHLRGCNFCLRGKFELCCIIYWYAVCAGGSR
jgi:hypothetical protein